MKVDVVKRPYETAFDDVEIPQPGPYEALAKIELCVICNARDRMIIKRRGRERYCMDCVK